MADKVLEHLGRFEIGLVSERHEAREAEAEFRRHEAQLEREVAALRDQPDRAGDDFVRAELEPGRGVEDPETVRPEQDCSGLAYPLDDGELARASVGSALAEARGDADQRLGAGGQRGVDRLLEAGGRNGHRDELGRLGQLGEGAVGLPPEDLAAVAIHQEHRAPSLALDRPAGEPVAPLGRVVRGSEHGDRARIEEGAKVPRHGVVT